MKCALAPIRRREAESKFGTYRNRMPPGASSSAHAQMLAHQPHALGAEPFDAVLVAVDPEIADDVLIRLRRVHRLVVRLVKRRIDEHEIALPAAHDPHVILFELERLLRAAARRTRAPRQQLLRNFSEARDEIVDRMRPLLDEALVRAARTQLADVDGLIFRNVSVGNVHSWSG